MKQLIAGSLALAILTAPGLAKAADIDIYVGVPPYAGYYDGPIAHPPGSGTRVYGYYSEGPRYGHHVREFIPPYPRNGCGEYHYWNGEVCLDARDYPPDVR